MRHELLSVGKLIGGPNGEVDQFLKTFIGVPAAAVANRFVTSTNMLNGAYTIANGGLPGDGLAHNVTVTHTTVAVGTDTLGTLTVIGRDINDNVVSEVITPVADSLVSGAKAFKSITSITGAGWVIAGGNDTLVVGFGDIVGLPNVLPLASDVFQVAMGTALTNAPTIVVDPALCKNTVLATGANGTLKLRVIYLI